MPFYVQYGSLISDDLSKKLLKEYASRFPEINEGSEKIDGELEQIFINYAILLQDKDMFEHCKKELRKVSVETRQKFSLAIKRREAIESVFSEANEKLRKHIKTQAISDFSLDTLNSMTADRMLKCFDTLHPKLDNTELEIFKKSENFQKSVSLLLLDLFTKASDLFVPLVRGCERPRASSETMRLQEIINELFDCLDASQIKNVITDFGKQKNLNFHNVNSKFIKYAVSVKNKERLNRIMPFIQDQDQDQVQREIFEYSLLLQGTQLLERALSEKIINDKISSLLSQIKSAAQALSQLKILGQKYIDLIKESIDPKKMMEDILCLVETVNKNPDFIKKINDENLVQILIYLINEKFDELARKLMLLYPDRITPFILKKMKAGIDPSQRSPSEIEQMTFDFMFSARRVRLEESYNVFSKNYSEAMQIREQISSADSKEVASESEIKRELDDASGPTPISHKLFAHIQNDHEDSGTKLQGGQFFENTDYLLKTLEKMKNRKECSEDLYVKMRDYFREIRNWENRLHILKMKALMYNKRDPKESVFRYCRQDIDSLNNDILKDLYNRTVVRLPGGYSSKPSGHAMLYELRLENENVIFQILNTGDGLSEINDRKESVDNHLRQESIKTTRFAPMLAYCFTPADSFSRYRLLNELVNAAISPQIIPLWDVISNPVKADAVYRNFRNIAEHYGGSETAIPGGTDVYIQPQHSGICSWKVIMAAVRVLYQGSPKKEYTAFKLNFRIYALLDEMARLFNVFDKNDWRLLNEKPDQLALSNEVVQGLSLHQLRQVEHAVANISRSIEKYSRLEKLSQFEGERMLSSTYKMQKIKEVLEKVRNKKISLSEEDQKNQLERRRSGEGKIARESNIIASRSSSSSKKNQVEMRDVLSASLLHVKTKFETFQKNKKKNGEKRQKAYLLAEKTIEGESFIEKLSNLKKYIVSDNNPLTPEQIIYVVETCLGEQALIDQNSLSSLQKEAYEIKNKTEILQTILAVIHQYNLALSQSDWTPYASRVVICFKLYLFSRLFVERHFMDRFSLVWDVFLDKYESVIKSPFFVLLNKKQIEEYRDLEKFRHKERLFATKPSSFKVTDFDLDPLHRYTSSNELFIEAMLKYANHSYVQTELKKTKVLEGMVKSSSALYIFINAKNGKYPGVSLPQEINPFSEKLEQLIVLREIFHETASLIQGRSADIYFGPTSEAIDLSKLYSLYSTDRIHEFSQGSNLYGKKYLCLDVMRSIRFETDPKPLEKSYRPFAMIRNPSEVLDSQQENNIVLKQRSVLQKRIASLAEIRAGKQEDRPMLTLEFMKTHFGLLKDTEVQLVLLSNLFGSPWFYEAVQNKPQILRALCCYLVQTCHQALKATPLSEQGQFLLKVSDYLMEYLCSTDDKCAVELRQTLADLGKELIDSRQVYLKIQKPTVQETASLEAIARSLMMTKGRTILTKEVNLFGEDEKNYLLNLLIYRFRPAEEPIWSYDTYREERLMSKVGLKIMNKLREADSQTKSALLSLFSSIFIFFGFEITPKEMTLQLPYLLFKDYALNLETGEFTQTGRQLKNLPRIITTNPTFEQYFGKGYRGLATLSEDGYSAEFNYRGSEYQCHVICRAEMVIKRKLTLQQKSLWYTLYDVTPLSYLFNDHSINFPLTFFDKRFEHWVCSDQNVKNMLILENGLPYYLLDRELTLIQKGELTSYVLQDKETFSQKFTSVFGQFKNFESEKFIEFYKNKNQEGDWLVRLPRYNLSFAFASSQWMCREHSDYYLEPHFLPSRLDQLNACLHLRSIKNRGEEWVVAPRQRFRRKNPEGEKMSDLAENEYRPLHFDREGLIYEENDCSQANGNVPGPAVAIARKPNKHRLHGAEHYALYLKKESEVEANNLEDRSLLAYLYMGLREHQKVYEELLKIHWSREKPSLATFENLRRIVTSVPEKVACLGEGEEEAVQSAEVIAIRQLTLSILFRLQARFPEILTLKSEDLNFDDLFGKTRAFQDKRTVNYVDEQCLLGAWLVRYTDYLGIQRNIPAKMRLSEDMERMMLIRCHEHLNLSHYANANYRYHQLQLSALIKMKSRLLEKGRSQKAEQAFISQIDNEIAEHQLITLRTTILENASGKAYRKEIVKKQQVEETRPYRIPQRLTLKEVEERNIRTIEQSIFNELFEEFSLDQKIARENLSLPVFESQGEPSYLKALKKEIDNDLLVGVQIVKTELARAEKAKAFFSRHKDKMEAFCKAMQEAISKAESLVNTFNKEIIERLNQAPNERTLARLYYDLARLGKTAQALTLSDAFDLFLQNDLTYYQEKTKLPEAECQVLHQRIYCYLQEATHLQHLQTISAILNDDALSEPEKQTKLGVLLTQKRAFKASEHPDLLLFEYLDNKRLSSKQADYLASLSGPDANPYQTVQLIMGGGKSKVLNPLLALRFADGLHLVMLIVPQALVSTNFEDLGETFHRLFAKEVHLFIFNRDSGDLLKRLKQIEDEFLRVISAREPIITTPESLQSLELKYLELLTVPNPDNQKIEVLRRILLILKNRTVPIVDEVDKVLSVKRQLNYTIGAAESIETHLRQANLALYEFLGSVPIDKEAKEAAETLFDVARSQVAAPPRKAWKDLMACLVNTLCTDKGSPLQEILAKLSSEDKKKLANYLNERSEDVPTFMERLSSKEKDILALYKEQICRILPETLLKKRNVDYGAAPQGSVGAEVEIAIPYDNGEPNIQSRFANYIISMNYTIQLHLNRPLTDNMLKIFLQPFAEKILVEKEANIGTLSQKAFETRFGLSWVAVTELSSNDLQKKRFYEALRQNLTVQAYCLEHIILPEVRQHKKMLSSNAQSFVGLFANRFIGFSGTDWNSRCYHPKILCQKEVSQGTDGQTLYHLLRKESASIYNDREEAGKAFTEAQVMARMSINNTHAFIDLGAWGADQTNLEFVQMRAFQEKLKGNQLEFILFFDNGKLQALSLKDEKITFLGQTNKEYIQEKLKVTPNKWFTYYDTPHTVGIDIAQAENARGILSIDKQSTLRDLLQAVMRMRKLSEGQQMDYLVPAAVRAFYPSVREWNLEAILKIVVQNQVQRLSEDILVSAFHKMDNMLREKVMERLLSDESEAERTELLLKFEVAVYQVENRSCYEQYGHIDQEKLVMKLLTEKKESIEGIIARLFKGEKEAQEVMKQASSALAKIIENTLPFVTRSILDAKKLAEQQATAETQREAQKESEREQENVRVTLEAGLKPICEKCEWWWTGASSLDRFVDNLKKLNKNNKEEEENTLCNIYVSPDHQVYPLETYLSSKQPDFNFDENIYVSRGFALSHKQQKLFLDDHVKNIHFILNIYDPEKRIVKIMIISIQDTNDLEKILFEKKQVPFEIKNIWIESPVGDVYCGEKPENLPISYYDQIQQINYLAGNLEHIYKNLDKTTWLRQDPVKKMAFYKEHLARIRDARPQIIDLLIDKLSVMVEPIPIPARGVKSIVSISGPAAQSEAALRAKSEARSSSSPSLSYSLSSSSSSSASYSSSSSSSSVERENKEQKESVEERMQYDDEDAIVSVIALSPKEKREEDRREQDKIRRQAECRGIPLVFSKEERAHRVSQAPMLHRSVAPPPSAVVDQGKRSVGR